MELFKINASAEAVAEAKGSSYISKSGIYDVVIKFASVEKSKGGATQVNFNIDYNGNTQTIYGPYIIDKAGQPIEGRVKMINRLGIIAGMGQGESLKTTTETHNVGKDNKAVEFEVIEQFSDLACKMRLQRTYSKFDGKIKRSMEPRGFYAANGASAEEIVNGTVVGVQLAKDEAYADKVTYLDGITPEEAEAWEASRVAAAKGDTPAAPKTEAPKASPALFA